jgi:hypothetical protein
MSMADASVFSSLGSRLVVSGNCLWTRRATISPNILAWSWLYLRLRDNVDVQALLAGSFAAAFHAGPVENLAYRQRDFYDAPEGNIAWVQVKDQAIG